MTPTVLPHDGCPLELARRVFARWRASCDDADAPVPAPLVEIAHALLACFEAADVAVALDVPLALLGATAVPMRSAAFVALPTMGAEPIPSDRVMGRADVVELDELVIDRPDGTRVRLRGRLPLAALAGLLQGTTAQSPR